LIEFAVGSKAYAKFELANLVFVLAAYNLSDPMTKHVKTTHLEALLLVSILGFIYIAKAC
jgi:hypothetical protein